jgi:hypothetical protein
MANPKGPTSLVEEVTDDGIQVEMVDEEPNTVGQPGDEDSPTVRSDWRLTSLIAGCEWDQKDYSCAFDATFMVFYVMYGQSHSAWRALWRSEAPELNNLLAEQFDSLSEPPADTAEDIPDEYAALFSTCRDRFRKRIATSHPGVFRPGHHLAPIATILEEIRGGCKSPPRAFQTLTCEDCQGTHTGFVWLPHIGYAAGLERVLGDYGPDNVPLRSLLSLFIEKYSNDPFENFNSCHTCRSPRSVRAEGLRLPMTSWLWFEQTANEQLLLPSLDISYRGPEGDPTHTLQAIIYLGGSHFTARIRKEGNLWWEYDGQDLWGRSELVTVPTEDVLKWFKGRRIAFIIYRRITSLGNIA